ncbi:MAG: hypothetical protein QXO96_05830, partial [Sulfolobales archaeon]
TPLIVAGNRVYRISYPIARNGIDRESLCKRLLDFRYESLSSFVVNNDISSITSLSQAEKDAVLGVLSMFLVGKEALSRESITLARVLDRLGFKEEFLFAIKVIEEEFKQTLLIREYIDKIFGKIDAEEAIKYNASFKQLTYEVLPNFSYNLEMNPNEENMIKYLTTFFLALEGIDAVVGYYFFKTFFTKGKELKDLNNFIVVSFIEDSRHIVFGNYLLSKILRDSLYYEFFLEYFSYVGGLAIRSLSEFINYEIDKWRNKKDAWGEFFKWIYEENGFEKLIIFSSKVVRHRLRSLEKMRINLERIDKMKLEDLGVFTTRSDVEKFLQV